MSTDFNPIYFDMDGVMCDTDGYLEKLTGIPSSQMSGNQKWKIMGRPGFFQQQPVMDGIHALLDTAFSSGRPVGILSSTGDKEMANRIAKEKAFWLNFWKNKYPWHSINLVRGAKHKVLYVREGAVLVDDMEENIAPWAQAGGIGILFQDVEQAHNELKEALSK